MLVFAFKIAIKIIWCYWIDVFIMLVYWTIHYNVNVEPSTNTSLREITREDYVENDLVYACFSKVHNIVNETFNNLIIFCCFILNHDYFNATEKGFFSNIVYVWYNTFCGICTSTRYITADFITITLTLTFITVKRIGTFPSTILTKVSWITVCMN